MSTVPPAVHALAKALGENDAWAENLALERQKRFGGLLTVDGACRLIAQEKNLTLPAFEGDGATQAAVAEPTRPLSALKAGEKASVDARVMNVSPPKPFNSKGREGKLQKIELADETGRSWLVLWNKDVDDFAALGVARGDCVHVARANVKPTYDGKGVELHAQLETAITKLDPVVFAQAFARFPQPDVLGTINLSALRASQTVDVTARVLEAGETREFTRDARTDRLCKVLLGDATGFAWAVGWDAGADALYALRPGDLVKIENASVKHSRTGDGVEVHVNASSRVLPNPVVSNPPSIPAREALLAVRFPPKNATELFELRDGASALVSFSIVSFDGVEKTSGKELSIARFTFKDADGKAAVDAKTGETVEFNGVAFGLNALFLASPGSGKTVSGTAKAVLDVKTNTFAGQREAIVRHWVSLG